MISAMLDLETLGTSSDAAVISIGVAVFDETEVIHTDGWPIKWSDWHGDINPQTVNWWMQQDAAARDWSSAGLHHAEVAATRLLELIERFKPEEWWANDPSFDIVILRNWWKRLIIKGECPISFRAERSFRTIKAEARRLGINLDSAYSMHTTAHNPVDDAANQARAVILARKSITSGWDSR